MSAALGFRYSRLSIDERGGSGSASPPPRASGSPTLLPHPTSIAALAPVDLAPMTNEVIAAFQHVVVPAQNAVRRSVSSTFASSASAVHVPMSQPQSPGGHDRFLHIGRLESMSRGGAAATATGGGAATPPRSVSVGSSSVGATYNGVATTTQSAGVGASPLLSSPRAARGRPVTSAFARPMTTAEDAVQTDRATNIDEFDRVRYERRYNVTTRDDAVLRPQPLHFEVGAPPPSPMYAPTHFVPRLPKASQPAFREDPDELFQRDGGLPRASGLPAVDDAEEDRLSQTSGGSASLRGGSDDGMAPVAHLPRRGTPAAPRLVTQRGTRPVPNMAGPTREGDDDQEEVTGAAQMGQLPHRAALFASRAPSGSRPVVFEAQSYMSGEADGTTKAVPPVIEDAFKRLTIAIGRFVHAEAFRLPLIPLHILNAYYRGLYGGTYFVKYPQRTGSPHERYFRLHLEDTDYYGPQPYLTWSTHREAVSVKGRAHLSLLRGVSLGVIANREAFGRFAVDAGHIKGPIMNTSRSVLSSRLAMTVVFAPSSRTSAVEPVSLLGLDEDKFQCWVAVLQFLAGVASPAPHAGNGD